MRIKVALAGENASGIPAHYRRATAAATNLPGVAPLDPWAKILAKLLNATFVI
jgi:hypothetical protein